MNLTIHRGRDRAAGSCVELSTGKARILIDPGMPPVAERLSPFDFGTLAGKPIDAVLIPHSPMDHEGLLSSRNPDIPVYMSVGAKELIGISGIFTPHKTGKVNTRGLKARKPFTIGNMTVTPYRVDRSACDALAFLVEGDGKRAFYSGDFRGHGRKSDLFRMMATDPPKDIDCLIMEGTVPGRDGGSCPDEAAVQAAIERILKSARTVTFLLASSQDINRLISAYRACLKTGAVFVIDIFTAYLLDRLRKISKHIPQFNWRNVRVKFDKDQARILAEKVSTSLLYFYHTRKIEMHEIGRKKDRILMLSRDNSLFPGIAKEIGGLDGARVIYSLWEGYLADGFKEYCAKRGLIIEKVHAGLHANPEDLKAFAAALRPKILVPIHTFEAGQYPVLFENVRILKEGEAFGI